jgi:hypothetical protein
MRWTRNSTLNGTCIVGCTGSFGSAANEFKVPRDLKFDRDGNLYVVDRDNHRVQKFLIQQSSCASSKSNGPSHSFSSSSSFFSDQVDSHCIWTGQQI